MDGYDFPGTLFDIVTGSDVGDTLMTAVFSSWDNAVKVIIPFLVVVMGFNIVVRLVRRFAKG